MGRRPKKALRPLYEGTAASNTAVAQALGKLAKFDQVFIFHQHPGAAPVGPKVVNERFDETFWRNNQRAQISADERVYKERKGNGFRGGLGRVSGDP